MADETSFEFSVSSASGAAALVFASGSSGRQTHEGVSPESSVSVVAPRADSAVGKADERSRSPSSRLPAMQEEAVVPYVEGNELLLQGVQGETGRTDASSGDRRGSSRDAAGTQRRALTLRQPLHDPIALGAWMGVRAHGAPGTPSRTKGAVASEAAEGTGGGSVAAPPGG